MTPSDLLKIISQGESETVEFKQEFAKTRSANRDIAAFANSQEDGLVAFDRSPIHETSPSELNAEQLDRYFQRTIGKQVDEFEIANRERVRRLSQFQKCRLNEHDVRLSFYRPTH